MLDLHESRVSFQSGQGVGLTDWLMAKRSRTEHVHFFILSDGKALIY